MASLDRTEQRLLRAMADIAPPPAPASASLPATPEAVLSPGLLPQPEPEPEPSLASRLASLTDNTVGSYTILSALVGLGVMVVLIVLRPPFVLGRAAGPLHEPPLNIGTVLALSALTTCGMLAAPYAHSYLKKRARAKSA